MFIRVVARVLELTEDSVLQGLEPKPVFIWATKYIRYDNIEYFEQLEKNKTILYLYDGTTPIIIKENIDKFHERLDQQIKKDAEQPESEEEELVLPLTDEKDEE